MPRRESKRTFIVAPLEMLRPPEVVAKTRKYRLLREASSVAKEHLVKVLKKAGIAKDTPRGLLLDLRQVIVGQHGPYEDALNVAKSLFFAANSMNFLRGTNEVPIYLPNLGCYTTRGKVLHSIHCLTASFSTRSVLTCLAERFFGDTPT